MHELPDREGQLESIQNLISFFCTNLNTIFENLLRRKNLINEAYRIERDTNWLTGDETLKVTVKKYREVILFVRNKRTQKKLAPRFLIKSEDGRLYVYIDPQKGLQAIIQPTMEISEVEDLLYQNYFDNQTSDLLGELSINIDPGKVTIEKLNKLNKVIKNVFKPLFEDDGEEQL